MVAMRVTTGATMVARAAAAAASMATQEVPLVVAAAATAASAVASMEAGAASMATQEAPLVVAAKGTARMAAAAQAAAAQAAPLVPEREGVVAGRSVASIANRTLRALRWTGSGTAIRPVAASLTSRPFQRSRP